MRYLSIVAAAGFLLSPAARADLTVHYKTSFEFAPGLPPALADAMKLQMSSTVPAENSVQIHGDQVASKFGALTFIMDYGKKQLTVLHPATSRFATVPISDFSKQVEALLPPAARQAMQGVKVDINTGKSGKTAVVRTVPAEETLITLSIETPSPSGPPVPMRMEMHNWMATPEALERFPELKQWNAKQWASVGGVDPAEIMVATFAQGPSAEKVRTAMRSLAKESTGLSVKTETRVFMPFLAQMVQAQGANIGDAPLVSTIMEMDRFNADPVPASAFEVPTGYKPAAFVDLMREFSSPKPK